MTAGAGTDLEVEYARFARHNAPMSMRVRLAPGAVEDDEARIWLDAATADRVRFERIEPAPDRVEAHADRQTFVFPLEAPGAGAHVVLHLMPQAIGGHTARLGLEDGPSLRLPLFVYP